MKSKILIIPVAAAILCLSSCSGDHSTGAGKDTNKNTYRAAKDTAKVDTGKMDSPDHTAAGGADLLTDTSKKAKTKK